jgi:KUP system potassium uptake protein
MNDANRNAQPTEGAEQLHGSKAALILGAIGVVFGDIGTSPLYTLGEVFRPEYGLHPSESTVLGVLSLVTWALVSVVAIKYVTLVMRADNRGEGGIMALMTLAQRAVGGSPTARRVVMLMALLGAALFFGDGVITPSISVLSAVEGLEVMAPALQRWVVPLAVLVLLFLFWLQKHGTAKVGALFGPVMLAWFVALAALGIWNIWHAP